jgi:undecaprenyl phosphate N,N'-diacetylbacillosamine 1-phosphate transferase
VEWHADPSAGWFPPPGTLYRRWGKRLFDLLMVGAGTFALLPVIGLLALLVRGSSAGPVLFRQTRLGLGGQRFVLLKFRTMLDQPRIPDRLTLWDDPETTRVGRFLRRFKLDELPQLFNVLAGDMSLVGPRPCLPDRLEELDGNGRLRLQVRPGLTGLAQVHGNVYLSWEQRWHFDAEYVSRMSLTTDVVILLRTIAVVLAGERRFLRSPGAGH